MTEPHNLLSRRRWRAWANDAGERAIRTYAQATVAALPVVGDFSIEGLFVWEPHSIGLGAAAISVLMSLAAKQTGAKSTAKFRG
jgi:hypothetical protein